MEDLNSSIEQLRLNDIKDIVPIPDSSLYYFSALVIAVVLLLIVLVVVVLRLRKREKKMDLQKHYLTKIKEVDLNTPKECAYALTYYGNLLEKDLPQQKAYENLVLALEAFKYRKKVDAFDDAVKREYDFFIGTLDA